MYLVFSLAQGFVVVVSAVFLVFASRIGVYCGELIDCCITVMRGSTMCRIADVNSFFRVNAVHVTLICTH